MQASALAFLQPSRGAKRWFAPPSKRRWRNQVARLWNRRRAVSSRCFATPKAHVSSAFGLQEHLMQQPWPSTLLVRPEAAEGRATDGRILFRGLRVRVGVHIGYAIRADGRIRGPGVYQLARIAGAAHGGQVLLSEVAWRRLRDHPHDDVVLKDLGAHRLTGVDGMRRLVQVLPRGLGDRSFPELNSAGTQSTNLAPEEDFVGRQQDVAALLELTKLGVRLNHRGRA